MPKIIIKEQIKQKDIDRFHTRYKKKDGDKCWEWDGKTKEFTIDSRNYLPNRLSYIIYYGTIPYNKLVLKSCKNDLCIRPQHLFLGTQKNNAKLKQVVINGYKECIGKNGCGEWKLLEKFYDNKYNSSGFTTLCKICNNKFDDNRRFKKYNITKEYYQKMLKQQNYVCLICDSEDKLVIDHNHQTGIVRGLICQICNIHLIPCFEDNDKEKIQKIIDNLIYYLGKK